MPRFQNYLQKRDLLIAGGIFTAYFAVAHLTRAIFYSVPGAPAITLVPAGIALAALVVYGYRFWPALALASLVNGFVIATPLVTLLTGTAGNVLQALVGTYVLQRAGFDQKLARLYDVFSLIGVAVFVTLIGPTFRIIAYWLNGASSLKTSWNLIWLASIMSVIIFTPLLVRWITFPQWKRIRASLPETALLFTILIAVNFLIFWTPYTNIGGTPATPTTSGSGGFSVAIVQLALLLWIALRMGMARMTLALFMTAVIGLTGPYFGMIQPTVERFSQRIIGIELYIIIFAVLYYMITAISEERDDARARVERHIADLQQALARISDEDRKKNEFIAALAHELRNPLAPIVHNLQIMEMEGIGNSIFRDAAAGIDRQVKNIIRLIEDLLDLSRITQGKARLQKEKADVRAVIQCAVHDIQPFADAQGHALHVDLPGRETWAWADTMRLEQIFTNLLHNAVKFTEPGGAIWISCREEGASIVIAVRDAGKGIHAGELAHIFDLFASQPDQPSASRLHAGLGIGLHLVKLFVELHGGTVEAESDGAGKGCTFTVRLPRYQEMHVPAGAKSATPAASVSASAAARAAKKILVVDDSEDVMKALSQLLTKRGYVVDAVPDGAQALAWAQAHAFDAALIDIGLPDMSGYEVARRLRSVVSPSTILIALTGYGQQEDKLKAKDAGFDRHLTKPIPLDDIEKAFHDAGRASQAI